MDARGKKHYIVEAENGKLILKAPRGYSYYTFTEYNDLFLTINGKPHLISDDSLGAFRTYLEGDAWDSVYGSSALGSSTYQKKYFAKPKHKYSRHSSS